MICACPPHSLPPASLACTVYSLHPFLTVFTTDSLCLEAHFSCTFLRVLRRDGRGLLLVLYCLHRLPTKNRCPLALFPLLCQCFHIALSRFPAHSSGTLSRVLRRVKYGLLIANKNFIRRFSLFRFYVITSPSDCFYYFF